MQCKLPQNSGKLIISSNILRQLVLRAGQGWGWETPGCTCNPLYMPKGVKFHTTVGGTNSFKGFVTWNFVLTSKEHLFFKTAFF